MPALLTVMAMTMMMKVMMMKAAKPFFLTLQCQRRQYRLQRLQQKKR